MAVSIARPRHGGGGGTVGKQPASRLACVALCSVAFVTGALIASDIVIFEDISLRRASPSRLRDGGGSSSKSAEGGSPTAGPGAPALDGASWATSGDARFHGLVSPPVGPLCGPGSLSAALAGREPRGGCRDDKNGTLLRTPGEVVWRSCSFRFCLVDPGREEFDLVAGQQAWWPSLPWVKGGLAQCDRLRDDFGNTSEADAGARAALARRRGAFFAPGGCVTTPAGKDEHLVGRVNLWPDEGTCRAARAWRKARPFLLRDGRLGAQERRCLPAPLPPLPVAVAAHGGVLVTSGALVTEREIFHAASYSLASAGPGIWNLDRAAAFAPCRAGNGTQCPWRRLAAVVDVRRPWGNGIFHWHLEVMPSLIPLLADPHRPRDITWWADAAPRQRPGLTGYRNRWLAFWGVPPENVMEGEPGPVFADRAWAVGGDVPARQPWPGMFWLLRAQRAAVLRRAREIDPASFAEFAGLAPYTLVVARGGGSNASFNGRGDGKIMNIMAPLLEGRLAWFRDGKPARTHAPHQLASLTHSFTADDAVMMGSVARQVAAFHCAAAVFASQGAGLANLLYARPGAVAAVRDDGQNVYFVHLAMVAGLRMAQFPQRAFNTTRAADTVNTMLREQAEGGHWTAPAP